MLSFETRAPRRRVSRAGGVRGRRDTQANTEKRGLQMRDLRDTLRSGRARPCRGESHPGLQDTNPRAVRSHRHEAAAARVISVCTAADARVPQLSALFYRRGDHQGRKNGREGPMLPSDASPALCCSRNFIQHLTKCTYFSNSTEELLLLDILCLSLTYVFQFLQTGCLNAQGQHTALALLFLATYR